MGHIAHQALCLKITAKIMAIIVVKRHIPTNTEPMATRVPPDWMILYAKKAIKPATTSQRNACLVKGLGIGLLGLNLDIPRSKNAPLGHRCQHQYRPLKKDSTSRNAIMATTRYPKSGTNKPPTTIRGNNHTIINCDFLCAISFSYHLPIIILTESRKRTAPKILRNRMSGTRWARWAPIKPPARKPRARKSAIETLTLPL